MVSILPCPSYSWRPFVAPPVLCSGLCAAGVTWLPSGKEAADDCASTELDQGRARLSTPTETTTAAKGSRRSQARAHLGFDADVQPTTRKTDRGLHSHVGAGLSPCCIVAPFCSASCSIDFCILLIPIPYSTLIYLASACP